MLVSHLRAFYPYMRTQLTYERTRIDAQIGKVGIEIKYQPDVVWKTKRGKRFVFEITKF